MRILFVFLLAVCVLPADVLAEATESGVAFPETKSLGGEQLVLNGTGTRKATWFKVKVYAAALYVSEKSSDAAKHLGSSTPKFLVMQFVRDVEADKLQDGWTTGLEKNSVDFSQVKDSLATFNSKMKDVQEGDKIAISFFPGEKVITTVAGGAPFEISNAAFPRDLLAIWLGGSPPNEDLKQGLLGK